MNKLTIVLFGSYGSGKGTQARLLKKTYNMQLFDTGSVLRQNVKNKTTLGTQIKEIMNRGDLVSNDLIMKITKDWIDSNQSNSNLLFDGIPRSLEQAEKFDDILDNKNITPIMLFINIPREESIDRQIGRKICADCGEIYSSSYNMDNCNKCNGILETRKENDPKIATKRADIFESETLPVIDHYKNNEYFFEINGMENIETVHYNIISIINRIYEDKT